MIKDARNIIIKVYSKVTMSFMRLYSAPILNDLKIYLYFKHGSFFQHGPLITFFNKILEIQFSITKPTKPRIHKEIIRKRILLKRKT